MKSSSTPIFKILSVVVLAAAVVYFAVQAYRYFSDPINTTLVYASVEEQTIEISGYLVREEETFHSDAATLGHSLSEGERVGKNQTMATAYPDSGALTRVEQLEALQLRLEQLSFSLISYLDPDAALKLDSTINSGILTLRRGRGGLRPEKRCAEAGLYLILSGGDRGGDQGHGAVYQRLGELSERHGYHRAGGGYLLRRLRRL